MKQLRPHVETLIESLSRIKDDDIVTAARVIDVFYIAATRQLKHEPEHKIEPRPYNSIKPNQRLGRFRQGVRAYDKKRVQLMACMEVLERLGTFRALEETRMPLCTMLRQYGRVAYRDEDARSAKIQDEIAKAYMGGKTASGITEDYHIVTVYDVLYCHKRDEIETFLKRKEKL